CRDKEKKGFHGKGFLRRLKVHVALIVYSRRLLDAYVDSGRTMVTTALAFGFHSVMFQVAFNRRPLLDDYKGEKITDSQAWRTIDEKFPKIAEDKRNLRLGISVDGVDVNTGNRHHSVWPVLNVIYNLPPWLCMKRKFINFLVLISGYSGNDIDVFLEPLVDDLHTLSETGVDTYDASIKDNFNLRAIVLWTIHDYPILGTLCGCPYSGFKGCIVCGKDTNCVRVSASSKQSYVGHRRYLPYNHPFKKQKKAFNGQQEFLQDPIPMTVEQIYNEVKHNENK
ncbi:putative transposon, En/Spm-like protein, partial [Tanacetum coccineum]